MSKKTKLICALLAAIIVGALMTGVMTANPCITAIDNAVIAVVVHHGQPLNSIVMAITNLGNPPIITIFSVLLAAYFLYRKQQRIVAFIATNMIVVNLANFIVKNIVQRARPFVQDHSITPLVHASGFSFPSGHSAGSVLLFGTIFILLGLMDRHTGWRQILRTLCILMILAIGLSRIYVQVHFPTDVLAGYALGTCGLMLSWAFMAPWLTRDGLPLRLQQ